MQLKAADLRIINILCTKQTNIFIYIYIQIKRENEKSKQINVNENQKEEKKIEKEEGAKKGQEMQI